MSVIKKKTACYKLIKVMSSDSIVLVCNYVFQCKHVSTMASGLYE